MSPLLIEPELREVLEDVVKQSSPSNIFADFTPTRFKKTFRLPDQTIGIAQAGLSTAERELIRVHRDKLAWLLREAFLEGFYAGDGGDWMVPPSNRLSQEELSAQARRIRRVASPQAYRYRSGYYLRRLISGVPIRDNNDLSSLLLASLRLADSSKARLYHGYVDMRRGDLGAAWRSLAPLLDAGEPQMAVSARVAWIKALSERGREDAVAQWSRDSVDFAMEYGIVERAMTMAARLEFYVATSPLGERHAFNGLRFPLKDLRPFLFSVAESDWSLTHFDEVTRTRIMSKWAR
jgi:hypothetical protein